MLTVTVTLALSENDIDYIKSQYCICDYCNLTTDELVKMFILNKINERWY